MDWIENKDGFEEKLEVIQAAKKPFSSLEHDEKVIQILSEGHLKNKIVEILQQTELDNYLVYDGENAIANIQQQSKWSQDPVVFMVAVKTSVYPQLLKNLSESLDKEEQELTSCSEALFQIRLGE